MLDARGRAANLSRFHSNGNQRVSGTLSYKQLAVSVFHPYLRRQSFQCRTSRLEDNASQEAVTTASFDLPSILSIPLADR